MKTVFVIVRKQDSDEGRDQVLLVTPSEEAAKAFIEERKAEDVAFMDVAFPLRNFMTKWYKQHPITEVVRESLEFVKNVTKEERSIINKRNKEVMDRNKQRLAEWSTRRDEAAQQFLVSIGRGQDEYQKLVQEWWHENVIYEIQPVEYRE